MGSDSDKKKDDEDLGNSAEKTKEQEAQETVEGNDGTTAPPGVSHGAP